jgi:hypothetical protein
MKAFFAPQEGVLNLKRMEIINEELIRISGMGRIVGLRGSDEVHGWT